MTNLKQLKMAIFPYTADSDLLPKAIVYTRSTDSFLKGKEKFMDTEDKAGMSP